MCIFATDLVTQRAVSDICNRLRGRTLSVKRESGENPEQSRCCELPMPQPSGGRLPPAESRPLYDAIVAWEGRGLWGASQKTCQITVLKLSRKELKNEALCMLGTWFPFFHLFHAESYFVETPTTK